MPICHSVKRFAYRPRLISSFGQGDLPPKSKHSATLRRDQIRLGFLVSFSIFSLSLSPPVCEGAPAASVQSIQALDGLELMVVSTVFDPGCFNGSEQISIVESGSDIDNQALAIPASGLLIADCPTSSCFSPSKSTEDLDISSMFCDLDMQARQGNIGYASPSGCVRWWPDLSPFDCSKPVNYPTAARETRILGTAAGELDIPTQMNGLSAMSLDKTTTKSQY